MSNIENPLSYYHPDISIEPYGSSVEIDNNQKYDKLKLTPLQMANLASMFHDIPALACLEKSVAMPADCYLLKLPKGISGDLMRLSQGGYSSTILDGNTIQGTASLYPIKTTIAPAQAALSAFSIISIATSQYFLAQINTRIELVGQKLDEILKFLHGDKRAELFAEISFVQYAHRNYHSIASHDEQRSATIHSLQESKKVAIKDIEFYINELDSASTKQIKKPKDAEDVYNSICDTKESLEFSRQLLIVSNLLEAYYSQNFDEEYLLDLKDSTSQYIAKSNTRIISALSQYKGLISSTKSTISMPTSKEKDRVIETLRQNIDDMLLEYKNGNKPTIQESFERAIDSLTQPVECVVTNKGDIYIKKIA